jgi:hypothetical protein
MSYETEQIPSGDVDPYPKINANDESYGQIRTFAHIPGSSSGLVVRIGGGDYGGAVIDGADLTATDDAVNYVVALKSTGALSISTATTNWNDTDYGRVCIAEFADGALVDDKVVDVRLEPLGIFGSQASVGAGIELKGLRFTSDTGSTADSDPGAGLFKWNAAQGSATKLFIDDLTADAVNLDTLFAALGDSGKLFIQQSNDADRWQLWGWTAAPTDDSGYWDFTVTLLAKSSADIEDGVECYFDFDDDGAAAGSGASTTQTGEMMSGYIGTVADKDYKIVVKAAHGGTITETTTISESGTATFTFKVNSTALGGTANSVSSAEQSQAHASTNTFAANDDIVITASSNSACLGASFTIKYTRTLA